MISLLKHQIKANINNRYATTKYLFEFENGGNYAKELKFELTINPDAFIAGFEASIDGKLFIGATKEKKTMEASLQVKMQRKMKRWDANFARRNAKMVENLV